MLKGQSRAMTFVCFCPVACSLCVAAATRPLQRDACCCLGCCWLQLCRVPRATFVGVQCVGVQSEMAAGAAQPHVGWKQLLRLSAETASGVLAAAVLHHEVLAMPLPLSLLRVRMFSVQLLQLLRSSHVP